jgi:hypothetical protein
MRRMEAETKLCPYCAEEIRSAAVKCKHCGSMLDGSPTQQAAPAARRPADAPPTTLFAGSPSWRAYFGDIMVPVLVLVAVAIGLPFTPVDAVWATIPAGLAALFAVYWMIRLRSERIVVNTARIETSQGILSRQLDTLELWRVNDLTYTQTLVDRLLGRSRITVHSQDKTAPVLHLVGLPGSHQLFQQLRDAVDRAHHARRVLGLIE